MNGSWGILEIILASIGTLSLPLIVKGAWTLIGYLDKRRDEIRWKRVEFLQKLAVKFDTDREMQECLEALEYPELEPGTNDPVLLRVLRPVEPNSLPRYGFAQEEIDRRRKFNRALSFLDDLYYWLQQGVLRPSEAAHYGYFLQKIHGSEAARVYCSETGFHNVLELYRIVREYSKAQRRSGIVGEALKSVLKLFGKIRAPRKGATAAERGQPPEVTACVPSTCSSTRSGSGTAGG